MQSPPASTRQWLPILPANLLEVNAMKPRNIAFVTAALVCLLSAPVITQSADDWVAINNPAELRAIYSNKTFKGTVEDGTPFVSHYNADGRGLMIYKGQTTPRTWEVKGKDQVCVVDVTGTNCFVYWRHRDKKDEIKGRNIEKGWTFQATVEDGIPKF